MVVGGGVIGSLSARALARDGVGVTVVDPSEPGGGATWAAGGMLSPLGEAEGPGPFLALGLESLGLWPTLARELEAETGRSLGFLRCGKLTLALDDARERDLRGRREWLEGEGHGVEWLGAEAVREREPGVSPRVRSALHYAAACQVDNRRLGRAAHDGASRAGARFRLGIAVRGIRREGGSVTGVVLKNGDFLPAGAVVVAAGAWSGLLEGLPRPLPIRPVRGQMVALRARPGLLNTIVVTPRVYLIPREDGRILVGSTMEEAGFERATTVRAVRDLLGGAAEAAPELEDASIDEVWAGLRPGTPDDHPVLGVDPEVDGLVYATGHFRNGILLSPVTARIVRELVAGRDPEPGIEAFRPDRFEADSLVAGDGPI